MTRPIQPPVVLRIAGLDPSGGAGVLADIKTISAFGGYGVGAVTSLTFQNSQRVYGTLDQSEATVRRQIEPLFEDFDIGAIKTGMLPSAQLIREVASMIKRSTVPIVVVDPVLRSSSGFDLVDEQAVDALTRYLLPIAGVVTPNVAEAARLTGIDTKNRAECERAAAVLLKLGPKGVLITGGDADSDFSEDLLLDGEGITVYTIERIRSKHTHGTGCTLASGLACLMAQGRTLREAIPIVKRYISAAILSAPALGQGAGPLNHFPPGSEIEN